MRTRGAGNKGVQVYQTGNVGRERDVAAADDTRKLATILAIDVVGYSAAAERDQVGAARRIAALRARIGELAAAHGGRLFHTAGDGFMLEFPLASSAVRAAIALLQDASKSDNTLPRVRAGAHLGEVMIDGEDLLGHGVNVAARLVAQAEPNALVISDAVKSQLHGEIDAPFAPLGPVHLSKMRESVLAYAYTAGVGDADWRGRARAIVKRRWRLLAVGAVVLAFGAVAAGVFAARPTGYVLGPMQMVAHSRRPEVHPTLSPDGRFVVYMVERGESLYTDTELYMRNVAGGEETQLTDTADYNEAVPTFSPTGDRLAYARWRKPSGSSPCEIMVRVFPSGLDRQVGGCEGGGPNRIAWTPDGGSLVYSNVAFGNSGEETSVVRILNLETGEARDLVPPLARGMGDMNATVSPDGERIAFVRYQSPENGDAFVYDLRTRQLTRVTHEQGWAQVAWADSQNLFVLGALSGVANELWLRRADGRGQGQRLLPGLAKLARPDTAAGLLAIQVESEAANLWRFESGNSAAITNGNQSDYAPDFSREGTLAFISSQSGQWLYLQAPGEPPRRLAEPSGTAADGLRWSPDGRRLVYAAADGGRLRIFITDVASGVSQLVRINMDEDLGNPAWSPDGRSIVFAATGPEGPRLFRVQLEGNAPPRPISDPGWYEAIETLDGVFAVSRQDPGIWRLSPGRAPELMLPDYRTSRDNAVLVSFREWTVLNGRFYVMDRSAPGRTRILSRAVGGGATTRVADVEGALWGSLAVDPVTGAVVYRVGVDEQYDIAVIPYRRR